MAVTIPTTEPTEFVSGDTVCWTKSLADFPADEYELTYAFVTSDNQFTVTCVAAGTDHYAEITIADSAETVGVYRWHSYATLLDDSERYQVGTGTCEVLTDFATETSGYDPRTNAEKMLDAINAVLVGRASIDQESMSIQGRSLSRTPIADLLKLKSQVQVEVRRERAAERAVLGLATGQKIRTRF